MTKATVDRPSKAKLLCTGQDACLSLCTALYRHNAACYTYHRNFDKMVDCKSCYEYLDIVRKAHAEGSPYLIACEQAYANKAKSRQAK